MKKNKEHRHKRPMVGVLRWLIGGALCVAVAALLSSLLSNQLSRLLPARTASVPYSEVKFQGPIGEQPPERDPAAAKFVAASVTSEPGAFAALGKFLPTLLDTEINQARDIECLALNIYHEARGEGAAGQFAVGHVVLNRVSNAEFPDTICDVVRERGTVAAKGCQFSWWCDGRSDKPTNQKAWRSSLRIAKQLLQASLPDPTGGALWYHADYVSPGWGFRLARGPQIGRHVFYHKGDPVQQAGAMPEPETEPNSPSVSLVSSAHAAEIADQFVEAVAADATGEPAETVKPLRFLIQTEEPAMPASETRPSHGFPPGESKAQRRLTPSNG